MTAVAVPTPVEASIRLDGIRWQTYEALRDDLEAQHRHLRLTYYSGTLEIMSPSPEHELYKKTAGRFVETLAEELALDYYPLGSTTYKRANFAAVEPDECFYFRNAAAVQGLRRIDLERDPPPDLALEIDITYSSMNRLSVYAALGVPEVWRYDGQRLMIYQLQNGTYAESDRSLAFPNFPITQLSEFLNRAIDSNYPALIREFREWVRKLL